MSTLPVKPIPTLQGIFSVPKTNHRKDFLRENKLSLRELQRVTTNNKAIQEQEFQQKQQSKQHLRQQQQCVNRRSASLTRESSIKRKPSPAPHSTSQKVVGRNPQKTENHSTCVSCNSGRHGNMLSKESSSSLVSRTESCDREIQTDDIFDEEFLYEALKKCSSSELNSQSVTKLHLDNKEQLQYEEKISSLKNVGNIDGDHQSDCFDPHQSEHQVQCSQNCGRLQNGDDEANSARTIRSHCSGLSNENHRSEKDFQCNLETLAIDNHCAQQQVNSHRTSCSIRSQEEQLTKKKSTGSLHKLGSRDNIQLPRYLEREKRKKDEKRMCEMERDPNCPFGHFALTNDERLAALAAAEKKFNTLINELNYMPMTIETLRIRNRKAEIEKELAMLEADMRVYSKQKVYVKQQE